METPLTAPDAAQPRSLSGVLNELLTRPLAFLERTRDGGEASPGRLLAVSALCYALYGAAAGLNIALIEKALESHNRKLEADKAALTANQKDRKRLEGEIQMHQQKISKLRDQMLGAKTNEQYQAFQHEIEFCQTEIRRAEDLLDHDLPKDRVPYEAGR